MRDDRARHYAEAVIRKVPAEVNRLLDEAGCPEDKKEQAKSHIYSQLHLAWCRRRSKNRGT